MVDLALEPQLQALPGIPALGQYAWLGEKAMKQQTMVYVSFCQCGGFTALAVADTVDEQIAAMPEVKRWRRLGFTVEHHEYDDEWVWCLDCEQKRLKA